MTHDEHQFSDLPYDFWEHVGKTHFRTVGGWIEVITLEKLMRSLEVRR